MSGNGLSVATSGPARSEPVRQSAASRAASSLGQEAEARRVLKNSFSKRGPHETDEPRDGPSDHPGTRPFHGGPLSENDLSRAGQRFHGGPPLKNDFLRAPRGPRGPLGPLGGLLGPSGRPPGRSLGGLLASWEASREAFWPPWPGQPASQPASQSLAGWSASPWIYPIPG